jgi:large subunit ribosomal protein L4
MTTLDVKNLQGETVGTTELPAEWFEAAVNIPVMHQVVTAQQAAARQGTHKTKTRAERSGGGRKPHPQKGGGRSRQGSIRSPAYMGGGISHGRTPSNWAMRVNRKMKRAGLRSALSDRTLAGSISVVRNFAFEAPKTKDAIAALKALGLTGHKTLIVLADRHLATEASLKNIPGVHTLWIDQLNVRDILSAELLVLDEAAIALIGTGKRLSTFDAVTDGGEA